MRGLVELQQLINETDSKADHIFHIVPHPDQDLEKASPLMGFTEDVVKAASVYSLIATLPKCIHDLLGNNEEALIYRIGAEPYTILPVELTELQETFDLFKPLYSCIWSMDDETESVVTNFIQTQTLPILHIAPSGANGTVGLKDINRESIRQYVVRVLEHQERIGSNVDLTREVRNALLAAHSFGQIQVDFPHYDHSVLRPNVTALKAAGFVFNGQESISGQNNQPIFDAMHKLVSLIWNSRGHITKELPFVRDASPYELILTTPSVLKYWRTILRSLGRNIPAEKRKRLGFYIQQIIGNGTYDIDRAAADEDVKKMLDAYMQDLEAYSAAITIRASSNFVPVISLPTIANKVRGDVVQLEETARVEKPTPRRANKLSRLAKRISVNLKEGLPEWMMEPIKFSRGVKLIADAPLEWMDVDGLPLALNTDVSRIPTTPGNLSFLQTVALTRVNLELADFDEVLVVSAFKQNDPVRNILKASIEVVKNALKDGKPKIKYVDVETEQDFIQAFDSYSGALAVYDGHGRHSTESDEGSLVLPDGTISGWDLYGRVRMPPIVVLSACDTHPMSASHATTANGFLAAGARTVIGTSLPVHSHSAAEFVARLLIRISQFLPTLCKDNGMPVRWSRIISGMQKRQYMTEAVYAIADKLKIQVSRELLLDISIEVGGRIDQDKKGWLDKLVSILADKASVPESEVRRLIENEAYLTDALIYVQFGNPEQISIVPVLDAVHLKA
jgi:hypothetical protein